MTIKSDSTVAIILLAQFGPRGVVFSSALVTTRQLEFYIIFVQLVNASLSYCKLEFF